MTFCRLALRWAAFFLLTLYGRAGGGPRLGKISQAGASANCHGWGKCCRSA